VQNVLARPDVELRVGGETFRGAVEPVTRADEMARAVDLLKRNYWLSGTGARRTPRSACASTTDGQREEETVAKLPRAFETFRRRFPRVHRAYEALGGVAHEAGPLDPKTRELVKLGIAIGLRAEGAVRSHAGRAQEAGATSQEIDHVVLLAVTTAGLPAAVAAFTWLEGARPRGRRQARRARS
jgi:AhpD family alkylhydroperoxidase